MSIDNRQEIINEIINSGIHNPKINSLYLALIFKALSGEVMVFERTGIDLITEAIQTMVSSNHPLKPALLSYVDAADSITVQQAIIGSLLSAES